MSFRTRSWPTNSSLLPRSGLIKVRAGQQATPSVLILLVTIVVLSRLAYRKGVDLLVATAPRICAKFPHVHFVIGT